MTKNSAFRALVIDDEPLAREELCQLLNETNEVQVLADGHGNAIHLGRLFAATSVMV